MSIPKEPRQQMINMMYLVLTAMLALNITREVLNAFNTINSSILHSNVSISEKNLRIYESFDEARKTPDSLKVKPFALKAQEIKEESDNLIEYLQQWKDTVINISGGYEESNGNKQIKSLENIDASTRLFVKEGKGAELKQRLEDFYNFLLSKVDDPSAKSNFENQLPVKIKELEKSEENPKGDWALGTFNNIPVVASVAMLSKFQNDIKNSESMIIEHLLKQVHADDYKFDALVPIAVPKTSYALEGQEIEATILLAAYNKSANPIITSNSGPVQVKDGVGTLKFRASGVGMKTVNGRIIINKGGKDEPYDYKFDYVVGSAGASLQLDRMNVMYIGVDNPITLSASGYNIEDVSLAMAGAELKSKGKGQYDVQVKQQGRLPYSINARDRSGATVKVGGGEIRVRTIPSPTASVGGRTSGAIPTASAKAQQGVAARLENFEFEVGFRVTRFRFVWIPRVGDAVPVDVVGNTFNNDCKQAIERSRPGDRWVFEGIRAVGPDKVERQINPVSLTLN